MEKFRKLFEAKEYIYVDTQELLDSGIKYTKVRSGFLPGKFDISVIETKDKIKGYKSNDKDLNLLKVYDIMRDKNIL